MASGRDSVKMTEEELTAFLDTNMKVQVATVAAKRTAATTEWKWTAADLLKGLRHGGAFCFSAVPDG